MTSRSTPEIKSLILWTIAMTMAAIVMAVCAYLVRGALLLIYVSCLLAVGFSPIVRFIERRKERRFPRWLAILVLYLAIIAALTLLGALVFPPLVRQAHSLWAQLPDMFDRAQQSLIDHGWLQAKLTLREAFERAPGSPTDAVSRVFSAVANVVGGAFGLLTVLILTFYILIDADSLRDFFLRLFPRERRPRVAAASRDATMKVSAWLGGQLLLGGVIGSTSAVGLWALGIPFFYVLAVLSGIGELIPVVGPILSAIPALAVAATISIKKMLAVLIFFILQQQLENHILVPKIMSRQVGVSPVTVIVALLIGGDLLGIVGAILAVPTAAILQVVAMEALRDDEGA